MNSVKPFIKKDDQALPDHFGVTIEFVTGKKEEFEVAERYFVTETKVFEILTGDNEWLNFPLANILSIRFDKRFSKVVDIRRKAHALSKGTGKDA
jgi:hypothetical protein